MFLFATYCLAAFVAIAMASWIFFSSIQGMIGPRLRRGGWIVRRLVAFYAFIVLAGLMWEQPWQQQWTNVTAYNKLQDVRKSENSGTRSRWVSDQLKARLANKDTLIAVSISGGGSRAAYFAAGILEGLSELQVPGLSGPGSSVASNIDVISSVSGGSVAAAYFAAHMPRREDATEENLKAFFARFKDAMAYDFEGAVARHIFLNPLNTGAYVTFQQSTAVALARIFDERLFDGKRLTFGRLIERAEIGDAPYLVLNATDLSKLNLFTFTKESESRPIFAVTQRPDPVLGRSVEELAPERYYAEKQLEPFGAGYGLIEHYEIAHAMAASAAYPTLFGAIQLGRPWTPQEDTVFLADGGLLDNSGLISLYAHLFHENLIAELAQKKKRIVVLAIDAGTDPEPYRGPIGAVYGMFDLGQQNIQRFVLPEMLRRAVYQDLSSIADREPGFTLPALTVFSYSRCSTDARNRGATKGRQVDTSFRLSVLEQSQIASTAEECGSGDNRQRLSSLLEGKSHERAKTYSGVLDAEDLNAWRTLLKLGQFQLNWRREYGRFATIDDVRRGGQRRWQPDQDSKYRRPPMIVDLKFQGNLDSAAFAYEIEVKDDRVMIFATPKAYKTSGRVSLVMELPDTFLEESFMKTGIQVMLCMKMYRQIKGGDLQGLRASTSSEIFVPYGVSTYAHCL